MQDARLHRKRAKQAEWQKAHPGQRHTKESIKRRNRARRARQRGATGSFSDDEFLLLCTKYNNRCLGPGPHRGSLQPDHIKPLCMGGSNDIGNIQPLCQRCNGSKGTKTIDYRMGV